MATWMIVEDEPDIYEVMVAMFELWDIKHIHFYDGQDAVEWIDAVDAGHISSELPELAILDIRLPGEVGGPAVGARLRSSPKPDPAARRPQSNARVAGSGTRISSFGPYTGTCTLAQEETVLITVPMPCSECITGSVIRNTSVCEPEGRLTKRYLALGTPGGGTQASTW